MMLMLMMNIVTMNREHKLVQQQQQQEEEELEYIVMVMWMLLALSVSFGQDRLSHLEPSITMPTPANTLARQQQEHTTTFNTPHGDHQTHRITCQSSLSL